MPGAVGACDAHPASAAASAASSASRNRLTPPCRGVLTLRVKLAALVVDNIFSALRMDRTSLVNQTDPATLKKHLRPVANGLRYIDSTFKRVVRVLRYEIRDRANLSVSY